MAVALPLVLPAAEALWTAIVYVGSAMVAAAGLTAASKALEEEFREEAPSSIQACPQVVPKPPPPECAELTSLIEARVAELKQRYAEMLADRHGLYAIRPLPKSPFGSWPGHLQQFRDKRGNLVKLMNMAKAKGCPISPEAVKWSEQEPPLHPSRIEP